MNDYSTVRGFNYQPSYAWNSYEAWRFFDASIFKRELTLGKKFFPKFNTVRLWLSYDAFRYEEDRQAENFEAVLKICEQLGIKAIPVLFNRWHDATLDNGGIYYTQMVPGSCWCATETMFDSYIEKIVKAHKEDDRILIWDICNEPFAYGSNKEFVDIIKPYEFAWLRKIYKMCKDAGAEQPVSLSHSSPYTPVIEEVADISDVFLVHPYYYYNENDLKNKPLDGFRDWMKSYEALSKKYNKPVLTTETCWGSLDDAIRAEVIENTLSVHREFNMGFIVHALHYSFVADLHNPEDAPTSFPGNLAFINKDDSLRKGHDIFNRF